MPEQLVVTDRAQGAASLMLGGFISIPGAIVGGLIFGAGEKLFKFLIGAPYLGGAAGHSVVYCWLWCSSYSARRASSRSRSSSAFRDRADCRVKLRFTTPAHPTTTVKI